MPHCSSDIDCFQVNQLKLGGNLNDLMQVEPGFEPTMIRLNVSERAQFTSPKT